MDEPSDEEEEQVPVLLISNDGQVTIQNFLNDDNSLMNLFSYEVDCTSQTSVTENSNSNEDVADNFNKSDTASVEKETLVNIDVNSEVLEGYMEVFVTYKCKECAYVSHDVKEFHQHCLEHLLKENSTRPSLDNTTYVYLCSSCSKAFNSSEETKLHMIEEHDHEPTNETFSFNEVPEMMKTINVSIETTEEKKVKKEIVRKKRKLSEIIHSIDPTSNTTFNYSCARRNCSHKFSTEKDLSIHEKCHVSVDIELENNSKKLFQCFECNELFNDWHGCTSHLYKAHEIDCDLLKCPVCETYRTSIPLRLENHIRIHSDVRAFTCKQCGKTFKQASQLRNHSLCHSDKESANKPNWSTSKQCNICFKMYSNAKSLKKHKGEVHNKLRPFVCNICGHASARKSMLMMHQRQHTGQKPYKCYLCPYRTADHNSLRKHNMRHTGVRPYKCPHCDYAAIQSGSYKNHMKLVHPNMEGMFVCNVCFYKTISEDNHVRHISDHLTGLIKDDGTRRNSEITAPSDFITTSLIRSGVRLEEEKLESVPSEYVNHNVNQVLDEVIDTGGITIPAESNASIIEHKS